MDFMQQRLESVKDYRQGLIDAKEVVLKHATASNNQAFYKLAGEIELLIRKL